MKKYLTTFIAGISILLPIGISVYVVCFVFNFMDKLTGGLFKAILGRRIPGIGFITTLALIYLAGLLTKTIIGKTFINKVDELFLKIPIIQHIYSAIKGLSNSIFKKEKISFKQTVFVHFPNNDNISVGFITSEKTIKEGKISVFIPTVPNPTTGFLILVNKNQVEYTSLSFEEAFSFILSLGVNCPNIDS